MSNPASADLREKTRTVRRIDCAEDRFCDDSAVTIVLSVQALNYVHDLLNTGLFGLTPAEVVERLFYERLRGVIAPQAAL